MFSTYLYFIVAFVISIAIGVAVYFFAPFYDIGGFEKALEGVLLLSSISLGFYGACLSVIASIFNTKVVKEVMNDSGYRNEFIFASCCSLGIGFLTVVTTIVYQVMLENKNTPLMLLKVTNASWFSLLLLFFSMILIFVFLSFSIFFNNKEKEKPNIANPKADYDKLNKIGND